MEKNKSILEKMRVKPAANILLIDLDEVSNKLLKSNKNYKFNTSGIADYLIFGANSLAEFKTKIKKMLKLWNQTSSLWVIYPKSDSKNKLDINRDILMQEAKKHNLEAVANIAISTTHSSVRLAVK